MTLSIKRTIAVLVIACMSIVAFACVMNADNAQAVSKSAINKMAKKSKNGFKKFKGGWYYIKSKKVVKGLKKIKGKYYFFDKKGTMVSGAKKIKSKNYYFKKIKSGKTKGQAPALADQALKKGSKAYFYDSKGVRYEFKYNSTGNEKYGDAAVGKVLSAAKVKASADKQANLEKVYKYIVKKYGYIGRPRPKLKSKGWEFKCAYDMVMGMNSMGTQKAGKYEGKCYNFAAITGLAAKALGFDGRVHAGTCKKPVATDYTEHAWYLYSEDGKTKILDSMWEHNEYKKSGKVGLDFFCKEVTVAQDGSFSLNGYDYK